MTSLVAALPGTTLIDKSGNVLALVIAYQYVSGNMVFPVFATARPGLAADEAIYDPATAGVSHPASQKWFETVDNWVEFAENEEWEAAATAEPAAAPVKAESATTHPRVATNRPEPAAAPAKGAPLKFGTKTFASKSFWHWAEVNAVFEIEPDQPLPADKRAVKVKRDDFVALKRDGATKIDPHAGVVDEAPATAEVVEEEDEDDVV